MLRRHPRPTLFPYPTLSRSPHSELEAPARDAVPDPHPQPLRTLHVTAQYLRGPDKPVGRAVDAAGEPAGAYRRVDLGYLGRLHLPGLLEPCGPLDLSRLPQRFELRLIVGQKQVPARTIAWVHA